MEYHINKIEVNKSLADLKHKLLALDGIMQAEFKIDYLHDTDFPIIEKQKKIQTLNIR